jgi:hypothetical protein
VTDPYELLAAFARWEEELVAEGRFAELADAGERWHAIVAALPPEPPQAARSQLEEAERTLASNVASLEAALDAVRGELARLASTRQVERSYNGAAGLAGTSAVDVGV